MELILTIAAMKNIFHVKYVENGERYEYDVGLTVTGGQIGNYPWAFDWHHDL